MKKRELTKAAKVAKIIKSELKKMGLTVRVKSNNYSGGNSVDVYLENVRPDLMSKIVKKYKKYEMGSFDGMTDCYNYDNVKADLPQVKFLFFHNKCTTF